MTEKKLPDQPSPDGAPTTGGETAAAKAPVTPAAATMVPAPPASVTPDPYAEYAWDADDEALEITAEDFEDAVGHEEGRILKRSNALLPSAWIEGPGSVELPIEGFKLLKGAARAAGTPMAEIKAVIAKALPKRNMILVAAAKEGAPGSVPTRRVGHGPLEFTISEILRAAEMEVTSGYRELYPVKKVAVSPIGPAIGIQLGKALVSRTTKPAKKKEQ